MKKKKIFFLITLGFGILIIVKKLSVKKDNVQTAQLNMAIMQEWSDFNPIHLKLASTQSLLALVQRKMTLRKTDGQIINDLAESIPQLKAKKAIWTIQLNAKWGDSAVITCADWHLGWQIGLSENVSVEDKQIYTKIKNIKWTEKNLQQCEVEYAINDWAYDRDLPPLVPSHIEKEIFEKYKNEKEGYDKYSLYVTKPTLNALYNGPYIISDFKLGSHIVFNKNELFFGKKANIDKIVLKLVTDSNSLKVQLQSNDINSINAVGFTPDIALMLNSEFQNKDSVSQVYFSDSNLYQGLFLNLDHLVLSDPIIRKVLSLSIDKEKIAKVFFEGYLPTANNLLSPQHPAFIKNASLYSLNKARSLLDKAGWKLNEDGVRSKNNTLLSFVFKTSAGLKVLENIQQVMCTDFKSIGIDCIIKNEPPRVLLGQSVPQGDFDMAMFGGVIPIDMSVASTFLSKSIPTKDNQWSGGNISRMRSGKIDNLIKNFDNESNKNKRNLIIKEIEDEILNQNYLIPIYHRKEAFVFPKKMQGLADSFDSTIILKPENWILTL